MIQYKQGTAADAGIMATMRVRFLTELTGQHTAEACNVLQAGLQRYFESRVADGTYVAWLAKDDGRVIATGGMCIRMHPGSFRNPAGVTGYVMNMFTLPEYRGRGICTELLRLIEQTGRDIGVGAFELHATEMGTPIYERNGYSKHHEPTYRKFREIN